MFKSINLELSLKPFKRTDDEYIRNVCANAFEQWKPLLKSREEISIMLWTGDGSELIDYKGSLDDEFDWCHYIGTAKHEWLGKNDPPETSPHFKKRNYTADPPKMTYRILKKIVETIKEEGKKRFPDSEIRVGETFDIGPEFAYSEFKYVRHREITMGDRAEGYPFIDATALLSADDYPYAAYPNGVPKGTPFGTLLGKQAAIFLPEMGFDYLWLSNGLGFSADPWSKIGKVFDGENYHVDKLIKTKKLVFDFWRLFKEACPDIPLETRGTNNSVGIDYATDGVPLYDIYRANPTMIAPPNSPWAALNDNYGLEIMGHMTRVCNLPNDAFPFRYYIHDPWWVNSPWYDRYEGYPGDIYLPMAISRIDKNGKAQSANKLNILSIDNSFGEMPDACVSEPLPHILKAEKDAPDEPAPFVWVYPMKEYTTSEDAEVLAEMNIGDNYICAAINDGFPLCSVVSSDNFLCHSADIYKNSVLISPVPETKEILDKLAELAESGIGIIFYGTKARTKKTPDIKGTVKVDVADGPSALRGAAEKFGYVFDYKCRGGKELQKPPTMLISRSDGAFMFGVYNCNTTSEARIRFPLGAPVLLGGETEIKDGVAHYHFSRGEHRECRFIVDQKEGVVSVRERAPVNTVYRRRISISGLENATVYFFPEKGCEESVIATLEPSHHDLPIPLDGFTLVHDEKYGTYLKGENLTGDFFFLMGYKEK